MGGLEERGIEMEVKAGPRQGCLRGDISLH